MEYISATMPSGSRPNARTRERNPPTGEPLAAAFPRRILIADHATNHLPEVAVDLAAAGHTIFETADVLATLEAIQERRPDLIVLSPLSPNLLGQEVRRVIAAKDHGQHTALLAVTDGTPDLATIERLGGALDDVIERRNLGATELRRRISLALGRLFPLRRLEDERVALERQSITDFKTGTYNDRYFHRRLREEVHRARRHRHPLACIMLDFDNFKEINDNFDHAFGDFVLLSFAKKLRSVIRDIDIPARFGGDEFVLLLPNTSLDEAVRIAERIRKIVTGYVFEQDGQSTRVTLSIGVANFDGAEDTAPEEFLRRSDCALLEAKRRGRDRIVLYSQITDPGARAPARTRGPDDRAADV
jgi:two-component system cell cycle response regulator